MFTKFLTKIFPALFGIAIFWSISAGTSVVFAEETDDETEDDPLRQAAEAGDAEAQYRLGTDFFYGSSKRKVSRERAVFWFRRAAALGLPSAQFNYAICLENGLGIDPDPHLALEFYTFAAEKGFKPAAMNRALLLLNGSDKKMDLESDKIVKPDRAAAMAQLKELADNNYTPAMVEIAAVELSGTDIKPEIKKHAFELLLQVSKRLDATTKGLRLLADCYYGGVGTKRDPNRTVELLRLAAKKKDPEAIAKLAFFYENGENVPQDKQKAFRLHKRAALAGVALSQYKYAEYICDGYEEGMGLNHAIQWYKMASEKNCPQAIHKLAMFAMNGVGMEEPDKLMGAELFFNAARMGYPPSQYSLACMFADGNDIPQDNDKAFFWFTQAAIRNYAPAMRRLGLCYYDGVGCVQDNEKAMEWLTSAAEKGDIQAQRMLESGSRSAW